MDILLTIFYAFWAIYYIILTITAIHYAIKKDYDLIGNWVVITIILIIIALIIF